MFSIVLSDGGSCFLNESANESDEFA